MGGGVSSCFQFSALLVVFSLQSRTQFFTGWCWLGLAVPLTSMIILRDAALIAAVFYVRYKTLSPPVSAQH